MLRWRELIRCQRGGYILRDFISYEWFCCLSRTVVVYVKEKNVEEEIRRNKIDAKLIVGSKKLAQYLQYSLRLVEFLSEIQGRPTDHAHVYQIHQITPLYLKPHPQHFQKRLYTVKLKRCSTQKGSDALGPPPQLLFVKCSFWKGGGNQFWQVPIPTSAPTT